MLPVARAPLFKQHFNPLAFLIRNANERTKYMEYYSLLTRPKCEHFVFLEFQICARASYYYIASRPPYSVVQHSARMYVEYK